MVAAAAEQQDWLGQLSDILGAIEAWSRQEGWLVARDPKTIGDDGPFPPYETEVLTIQLPEGRLRLDPIARHVFGGSGRIDLYAWPSLHRFMLVRENGNWILCTDSGVRWPKAWNRDTFIELARDLVRTP